MLIIPDLTILKLCVNDHPLLYCIFILASCSISFYCLKKIFALNNSIVDRIIFVSITIFAVSHFLLISFLLTVYQAIYFLYQGELRLKRAVNTLLWTFMTLIFISFGWVCYIQLLSNLNVEMSLSIIETVRKLYNYPKIFEKAVIPIIELGIFYEVVIAFCGIFFLFLPKLDDTRNNAISFTLILLLIGFCVTGIAKTLYNHIRYFYYLYPLFLILIAVVIVSARIWVGKSRTLKAAFVVGLSIIFGFQIWISWENVVNASPGSEERYSYSRIYLDHKTCGNYLNSNGAKIDYVITFASAHQLAVYFKGTIHACIKPNLIQYEGEEYHYITGSKFFETKEELGSLIKRNGKTGVNVWIFIDERYKKYENWENHFIHSLKEYTVCQASDQNTSLSKISYQQFLDLLDTL